MKKVNKAKLRKDSLLIKMVPLTLRSQGHVEFMISFVLFVTAILLLFLFLNPIGKTESKTKIQENAKNIILENISATVGKLDVITNPPYCYNFTLTSYGDTFYETNQVAVGPSPTNISYQLYFSPSLINYHPNYSLCNSNNFKIGVYSREKLIIKNKTLDLKKGYESDYKGTKALLGISNDFSFSFKSKNGNIIPELSADRNTSGNVEKFATEIPVRVIDDKANIVEMIINIKLW